MVVASIARVVVHDVLHLPEPLATVDMLKGNIHLNPTIVDVVAVPVDEILFDAIVSKWTVTAGRAPPLRRASKFEVLGHLELNVLRVQSLGKTASFIPQAEDFPLAEGVADLLLVVLASVAALELRRLGDSALQE